MQIIQLTLLRKSRWKHLFKPYTADKYLNTMHQVPYIPYI